jgi:glycosyltransferase involved in cell wall biosynthesis
MNILVISHMFPSKIRPTNGTFVFQQVEALAKLGHNITVLCPIPWIPKFIPIKTKRWREFQLLPKVEYYSNIKIYYKRAAVIPKGFERIRGKLFYLINKLFLNKLLKNSSFDIIHSHVVLPAGDLGLKIKQKFNIPLVITIHGADLFILAKKRSNKKRILKILKESNGIGVVSTLTKDKLLEIIPNQNEFPPIKLIYNGVKIYSKYPRIRWGVNNKTVKILSIGALIKRKKFDLVFEAVKSLKDKHQSIKYFIIGEGNYSKYYEQMADDLGLTEVITFLGPMPHIQAMSYLKESDIFVLPSIKETFGVVYIEAMYHKKLTIGTKNEGISDVIKNNESGFLIDSSNSNELTVLLDNLISNPEKYNNVCEQAHRTVWPKFSWENNAIEYQNFFSNLLKK